MSVSICTAPWFVVGNAEHPSYWDHFARRQIVADLVFVGVVVALHVDGLVVHVPDWCRGVHCRRLGGADCCDGGVCRMSSTVNRGGGCHQGGAHAGRGQGSS